MSRILLTGIATLDIINSVDHYPAEDEEMRAVAQRVVRGGNAANSACVLSQLGHEVELLATVAEDPAARLILDDLHRHQVGTRHMAHIPNAATPTSYITLNQSNGSRTIVHYRDLPEVTAQDFSTVPLERFDWFHFEGRNVEQTQKMLKHCRKHRVDQPISIEIEKPREDIAKLFADAEVLLFSRAYVQSQGYAQAKRFLEVAGPQYAQQILVCSWGEQGAWARDRHGRYYHAPACPPARIVDTVGAGDTFNAGIISALLDGKLLPDALEFACQLAGKKIGQTGFSNLIQPQGVL